MIPLFYIFISIVLYMIIHSTIKEAPLFQDAHPGVMSICVTTLCVIGMHQVFGKTELDFFLLLYAVLGIALLSVLLLKELSGTRKLKNKNFEKKLTRKDEPR